MRVLCVLALVACACAEEMLQINDHSWKTYIGDSATLRVNVSGERGSWESPVIYNLGNNSVEALYWEFKGVKIKCSDTGDINVSSNCETLSINSVQEKHGGFYYVYVNVTFDHAGPAQQFRILRGLNVNGPRYRDMLNDFYMYHIKVAGISAGSVLGFLMLYGLIMHFRYSQREERKYGEDDDSETPF